MITRRAFVGSLTGGLLTAPLAVEAQPETKVYRVGILSSDSAQDSRVRAFREGFVTSDTSRVETSSLPAAGRTATWLDFQKWPRS